MVCVVEAESEYEAIDMVQESLFDYNDDCKFPDSDKFGIAYFTFGEASADYAEEIED